MDFTDCVECDGPAEVVERFVLESTDGPVSHVRTRCLFGHNHCMPAARLQEAA